MRYTKINCDFCMKEKDGFFKEVKIAISNGSLEKEICLDLCAECLKDFKKSIVKIKSSGTLIDG